MSSLEMAPPPGRATDPEPGDSAAQDRKYWRSLDDLANRPEFDEFVRREFPAYADEMLKPASRRGFLKIMGASIALAGMTACRWPREEILPFTRRPEGYVPGNPMRFATAMELGGSATGLLVTSFDGRPVKVEGNPSHPQSLGGTNAAQQAAVLGLYDPDRSQIPVRREGGEPVSANWDDFDAELEARLTPRRGNGRGLYVLSEASSSPTIADLRERFLRAFPGAGWHEYEATTRDHEREGLRQVFGAPMRPHYEFESAQVIVSLGDDFLYDHPAAVSYSKRFFAGRNPDAVRYSRLYAVESAHTVTGGMADHRFPIAERRIPDVAGCLAAFLFLEQGVDVPLPAAEAARLRSALEPFRSQPLYEKAKLAGQDLLEHRGHALVTAGAPLPPHVHALVGLINVALGAVGQTVRYTADPDESRAHHVESLRQLVEAMRAGSVETLLILGGNPVFDAPVDLKFDEALGQVPGSMHLSLYEDETSARCGWHVPRAHFMESWGDARGWDGTLGVVQPLIEPLYNGRSDAELLARCIADGPLGGYEIVRGVWQRQLGGGADFERAWRRALHDGLVENSAWPAQNPRPVGGSWIADVTPATVDGFEVVFRSGMLHDGRWANNGWLMELPDPITKLTWDNAALMSPATADAMGVSTRDLVEVSVDGASVELPAYVVPGTPDQSVVVALGYGRRRAGRIGNGAGVDVYPLRSSDGLWVAAAQVAATGRRMDKIADTQDHFIIDRGLPEAAKADLGQDERDKRSRDLIREAELADYRHDPQHALHHGHHIPDIKLWDDVMPYDGYKWGMAIDLNSCTGCSTCVIACQAENNIPVVGKEEVWRGREMHWLRVDRYFSGDPGDPEIVHQPIPCQHCENAPCEQVCPVAATVHDEEGLNLMVYNRCIGTRYCSNNCPFKVRRFNYFNNHKNEDTVEVMVYNPEVTVRSRGVMEKCTFCLQRIASAKITAKNARRRVRDGEIVPACAQACPTGAISFGDLNDPDSRVREQRADPRNYTLLDVINVKPRVSYLGRIRNSNEAVAGTAGDSHHGTPDHG